MCEALSSIPGTSKKQYKEGPISPLMTSLNEFYSFKKTRCFLKEKGEHLHTVGRNINRYSDYGKQYGEATQNKEQYTHHWVCPEERKSGLP